MSEIFLEQTKKKEGMKDPLIKSVRNIFKAENNMIKIFLEPEENY